MSRPEPSEHSPYLGGYIANVTEDDVLAAMSSQMNDTRKLLESLPQERGEYRYAADKWSIKEMVGHITDTERVFTYRAMAIARGEQQSLPGFDQDPYMANAGFDRLSLNDLVESYLAVRRASILLFQQMPPEAWTRVGTASGHAVSVRALAYATVGHERHHLRVLREKYLVP